VPSACRATARGRADRLTDAAPETQSGPAASPLAAGLLCRCPKCAGAPLYRGPFSLSVADTCAACGLDLKRHEEGDGPAVLVILLLGFVVVTLALWVDSAFRPPWWVHALLWIPFISFAGLWMLRVAKAILIAMQFRHRRHEFDA
jgi:uncharacterized protein (DUF983 family)